MSLAALLNRRVFGLSALAAVLAAVSARGVAPKVPDRSKSADPAEKQLPVAVLLDQGATVIDFAGPWEVFQDAEVANVPGFRLFTVAASRDPLRATAGLQLVPDFSFDDAPDPRVIVLGAQGGNDNPEKLAWLRKASQKAEIVLSVCTGAFLLARTGLIDGMKATTHHEFYEKFEQTYPKVHLVRDRRFVDNGKFITAGGLTSGVDAALHVVSHFYGDAAARSVATYMEHDGSGWLSGVRERVEA
jgi:transcriptional regulator GlxA family with amidase domain